MEQWQLATCGFPEGLQSGLGRESSDKCRTSLVCSSSLREEVARFLSFYCKSLAPLKPENVSHPFLRGEGWEDAWGLPFT